MNTWEKCAIVLAYVHQGDNDILGRIARAMLKAEGNPEHPGDEFDESEFPEWEKFLNP